MQSWKSGTGNKYLSETVDTVFFWTESRSSASKLNHVLKFIHSYQIRNLGYSVLNTIGSMLSSFVEIDGIEVGKPPIIWRSMMGACNMNQSLPKHIFTWDVEEVVKHLLNVSSEKLNGLSKKI